VWGVTVRSVTASGLPLPGGPYAQATLAEGRRILSLSGQIAHDEDGHLVGGASAGEQARQCLRAIDRLLEAGGARKEDVVRVTVYLTDMADRGAVARAREQYFGVHRPAATLVQVAALVAPEYKVEIEATAVY
jgi:2-iminobutanoate/2-iminopropanoate deaminase